MKKTWYHDILRLDISEFVSFSACQTLEDVISRAREREIDLEHIGKKKAEQVKTARDSAKKPNFFYYRSRSQ